MDMAGARLKRFILRDFYGSPFLNFAQGSVDCLSFDVAYFAALRTDDVLRASVELRLSYCPGLP